MSTLEKQDSLPNDEMTPQDPVPPRLHPTQEIVNAVQSGDLRADAILQSLAYYAVEGDWQGVWILADAMKREISLLFDSQGLIWVDVGTPGMVRLSPPMGSRLPLRLWVHSHPWDAYWSGTDRRTLATVSGILEKAFVLGHDHMVRAICKEDLSTESSDRRLAVEGPLMQWTDEDAVTYETLRHNQEAL